MNVAREDTDAFAAAAGVLTTRAGLRLDAGARGRLARCVREEAHRTGLHLEDYVRSLGEDATLLQCLLDRVTVQESSFFRDPKQCELLERYTLAQVPEPVRLWSAGCANGQEVYTLAMILEESHLADWRIVATDLSRPALERTREAVYSTREMSGVSLERRERHFAQTEGRYSVLPALRERVTVLRHNLVTEPPPFERGALHIVFCRNVLIYVGPAEVRSFLDKAGEWLAPDGWLFLGFSESLWQVSDRFRLEHVGDSFVYRPRDLRAPTARPVGVAPGPVAKRTVARSSAQTPATAPTVRRPRPRPVVSETETPESLHELLANGELAIRAGAFTEAIALFRKCAYLEPDLPIAHLHLGLALEGLQEAGAARRAFVAARRALDRCDPEALDSMLEGYTSEELARLLDAKLAVTA